MNKNMLTMLVVAVLVGCEDKPTGSAYTVDSSAKDTTLAGLDANSNGVRDDLDAYIKTNFAATPAKMIAATAHARNSQSLVTDQDASREQIYQLVNEGHAVLSCMKTAFGTDWLGVANRLEARLLNNAARSKAYWASMNKMAGMAVRPGPCPVALK